MQAPSDGRELSRGRRGVQDIHPERLARREGGIAHEPLPGLTSNSWMFMR